MGSNLPLEKRNEFAKTVFGWAGERWVTFLSAFFSIFWLTVATLCCARSSPDAANPINCCFNADQQGLQSYATRVNIDGKENALQKDDLPVKAPPIVQVLASPNWRAGRRPTPRFADRGCAANAGCHPAMARPASAGAPRSLQRH
jgi:hypothetical protein